HLRSSGLARPAPRPAPALPARRALAFRPTNRCPRELERTPEGTSHRSADCRTSSSSEGTATKGRLSRRCSPPSDGSSLPHKHPTDKQTPSGGSLLCRRLPYESGRTRAHSHSAERTEIRSLEPSLSQAVSPSRPTP